MSVLRCTNWTERQICKLLSLPVSLQLGPVKFPLGLQPQLQLSTRPDSSPPGQTGYWSEWRVILTSQYLLCYVDLSDRLQTPPLHGLAAWTLAIKSLRNSAAIRTINIAIVTEIRTNNKAKVTEIRTIDIGTFTEIRNINIGTVTEIRNINIALVGDFFTSSSCRGLRPLVKVFLPFGPKKSLLFCFGPC